MNFILNNLKKNNYYLPISLGLTLSGIPFCLRPGIGRMYQKQERNIKRYNTYDLEQKRKYIFDCFYNVFSHAYKNILFYRDLYKSNGLNVDDINCFEDIKRVPIIRKRDLLDIPLEDRSFSVPNRLLVNTGGSSGKTLSFYMDPIRYGNEWAHIHSMWSIYGYKPSKLKINFGGTSNLKGGVQYDFARNALKFNIYADPYQASKELIQICKKHKVEYLHGYPSAISNFSLHCERNEPELVTILRSSLKAAFLSSEFPSPNYRNNIERVFDIPTQAFYGHTETCVMAVEKVKDSYNVFQTYGYAEAEPLDENIFELIGTSYFNFASPLIRYNTEDTINSINISDGILEFFKIETGRKGEFILDNEGKQIPLTGLVFGRHHELFNVCDHVQISQKNKGKAIIYCVSSSVIPEEELKDQFDSSSLKIDFTFKRIDKPIQSKSGKINLLVKE